MKYLFTIFVALTFVFSSCNKEPDVSFTSSAESITAGENIVFTNESGKQTFNTSWSFGDGGSANTWDASHVYQTAGTYTVNLSGTARRGNKTVTATKTIVVKERPGEAVEGDFADNMIGTWSLSSAEFDDRPCDASATKDSESADAKKFTFTIIGNGVGYITNHNNEQSYFSVELLNETTANISGFSVPLNNNIDEYFPGGLYTISLTESNFNFSRTEDSYNSWADCFDLERYSLKLTK